MGLYYPCSENKCTDQLSGYCEADLRLYFRKCKKPVFSQRGSYYLQEVSFIEENKTTLSGRTQLLRPDIAL